MAQGPQSWCERNWWLSQAGCAQHSRLWLLGAFCWVQMQPDWATVGQGPTPRAWTMPHASSGQQLWTPGTCTSSSVDLQAEAAATPALGLEGSKSCSGCCSHYTGPGWSLWLQDRAWFAGEGAIAAPSNLALPFSSRCCPSMCCFGFFSCVFFFTSGFSCRKKKTRLCTLGQCALAVWGTLDCVVCATANVFTAPHITQPCSSEHAQWS